MKKMLCLIAFLLSLQSFAQFNVFKKAVDNAKSILSPKKDSLSTNTIIDGLKEALDKGVTDGTKKLSNVDGFFTNAAIKILMPPEAVKVEQSLRKIGLDKQVDEAILNMNRAAEDACKTAAPIFVNAIKNMNIADAWGILKGADHAATDYLQKQTTLELTKKITPVIDSALQKINATKHWETIFSTYNKFSLSKVNPNLTTYVTEKALTGIFYQLAIEEQKIRKDPAAQTTELLKKVFGEK